MSLRNERVQQVCSPFQDDLVHVRAMNRQARASGHLLVAGRTSEVLCLLMEYERRFIDKGPVAVIAARFLFQPLLLLTWDKGRAKDIDEEDEEEM